MSPPLVPVDIQEEINKRLPVESLIRFRSVCKAWKSLIDSSEFIAAYSVRHTQQQHFLLRYEVGDREVKYVSFVDDDSFPQQKFALTVIPPLVQGIAIIGSSHGLLGFTGYFEEPDDFCKKQMIVLWNPAIRKSIAVVVPIVGFWLFRSVVGFGVCPDTKDPKLVMITYINESGKKETTDPIPCQVMVYTLSSGEWKTQRSSQLPRKSIEFTCCQTVVGQFIYWFAYDWIVDDDESQNLIMSFDMSTEEFSEVDLPDSLADMSVSDMSFSTLKESLVLLHYRHTTNKFVCDVWMMEHGDSKAFTKLFTINPPNASVSLTLGFRKCGESIVEMHDDDEDFVTPGAVVVVYEPGTEHIRDLGIRGKAFSFFGSSYTESLLLLNHDDGQSIKC